MTFILENEASQDCSNTVTVNVIKTSISLSQSLDYAQEGLMHHHLRVSLLCLYLGQALKLEATELYQLFRSAIIHDIGAVTMQDKAALHSFELNDPTLHCLRGYKFLHDLPLYQETAEIVRTHHDRWEGGNYSGLVKDQIPLASRIIHLADRVDVLLDHRENIIQQRDSVLETIRQYSGVIFDPDLVGLLIDLAGKESLWLDLFSPWIAERIGDFLPIYQRSLLPDELDNLASLFARVVDAKSSFTYMHSRGVAQMAVFLAEKTGMSAEQCFLMKIAGLLHDLGKLTIPEGILLKPAALTRAEMAVMKQHTYYTYWWLKPIFGRLPVAEWGAFHHERIDGGGYPFHKGKPELDLGSRIVAVSDIFTALREERPYRSSLSWEAVERIMLQQVKGSALDGDIVEILFQNKSLVDEQWQELAQKLKDEKNT